MNLDDPLSEVTQMSKYPAASGPVTMAVSDQTGQVVACGEMKNSDNKECYVFDMISWEPLPSLQENHSSYPENSYSYFMEGGLWVGGSSNSGEMVHELLNSEGQWITLPTGLLYEDSLYQAPCVVPLNSTHIFFSGGYFEFNNVHLVDTWILDLVNLEWTSSTPMLTPRRLHGCVLTDDGEVLIAGGYADLHDVHSVHIYNPTSEEWREAGHLPEVYPEIDTRHLRLLLWNDKVVLIEWNWEDVINPFVWEREDDLGWRLVDLSMGASFDGRLDNAVLVPRTPTTTTTTITTTSTTTHTTTITTTATTTTTSTSTTTTSCTASTECCPGWEEFEVS